MDRLLLLIISIISLLLFSCKKSTQNKCTNEISETNCVDMGKVLSHYKYTDPNIEKLKAAEFLSKNMQGYYGLEGTMVDQFNTTVDSLFRFDDALTGKKYAAILDSVLKHPLSVNISYDIKNIDSEYLIKLIDNSFDSKKNVWNKNLDFENFCEYVLPYRVGTEVIEDWKSIYMERFRTLIDSLNRANATDSIVGEFLMKYYKNQVAYELKSIRPELKPSVSLNIRTGDCVDYSHFTVFLCRAFGLPSTFDYIPNWGNGRGSHAWGVLIRPTKKCIPFNVTDHVDFGKHVAGFTSIPPKIYRKTASIQKKSLDFIKDNENKVPAIFNNLYYKDVTDEYFKTADISVVLSFPLPSRNKYAYLMVFDNQEWKPVAWSKIKNNNVLFENVAPSSCAYIVMYYHNNKFKHASYPFYVRDNQLTELKPQNEVINNMVLKRKYTDSRVKGFCKKMLGGKFQVANHEDFRDSVTIYKIEHVPEANYNTITININKKYKYFRYLAPEFSTGNVAEIQLFDKSGSLIKGEVLGTEGSYGEGEMDKTKVFDNDVLTFFDAPIFNGAWVGLKFGNPTKISKLVYLPRNDDNFIRDGERYELFYWHSSWKSLGEQIGNFETQQLIYNNVPKNALLLLKNLTKGVEERVFTYENDRQIWW